MNPSQYIYGRIVPNPRKAPADIEEVFADAVAEHLKEHADDGMSLFVFGTQSSLKPTLHVYPISAVDYQKALLIAQGLHERRGLPTSGEWILLFSHEDADQRDFPIQ